uniref:Chloroplast enveloppe membrane protein n=1 Tax=Colemanosphaera angeleri TaxID=1454018 RepID=A0A6C0RWT0_9CHLO|nr:chloroplast enveloppe membrane protein [Colemanosphaera angeleri]QIA47163.1 chloroplast enveloppe membrane protein [Colemanosphaera angeleri]
MNKNILDNTKNMPYKMALVPRALRYLDKKGCTSSKYAMRMKAHSKGFFANGFAFKQYSLHPNKFFQINSERTHTKVFSNLFVRTCFSTHGRCYLSRNPGQSKPINLQELETSNKSVPLGKNAMTKRMQIHRLVTFVNKRDSSYYTDKDKVVSITYEEIGLFPRSFSRVLDRFLKQLFSDVDNLVIQEYRFYRYLFLTTIKTIFILVFVPFLVNFVAKNYVVKPITEYFWNTSHPEIFLNSYEQKRAFAELKNFEEKIYFETLVESHSQHFSSLHVTADYGTIISQPFVVQNTTTTEHSTIFDHTNKGFMSAVVRVNSDPQAQQQASLLLQGNQKLGFNNSLNNKPSNLNKSTYYTMDNILNVNLNSIEIKKNSPTEVSNFGSLAKYSPSENTNVDSSYRNNISSIPSYVEHNFSQIKSDLEGFFVFRVNSELTDVKKTHHFLSQFVLDKANQREISAEPAMVKYGSNFQQNEQYVSTANLYQKQNTEGHKLLESKLKAETTRNNFIRIYQEKTIELATYYNNHSIEAITNFFADLLSLCTLLYLLITLSIQINITKSFLLEVFFGLDDSKKSLLILLITDLLVGYHSSNLWELFFEFIFNHYGIPESQTGIFLLVATLPVLLDVLFKYLIFRHLNRSSPATVATYQAIIE